jgi:2-polyprenyl-3-methyl-5-hydroxy-6-metoxy-1,4-benzoquinol methylase
MESHTPQSARTVLETICALTERGDREQRFALLWGEWQALYHYLNSFRLDNAGSEVITPYVNDALPRFLHTLDILPLQSGLRVLELGANPYLFTLLMQKFLRYDLHLANFTGADIYDTTVATATQRIWSETYGEDYTFQYTSFNMELSDYPYPDEHFDLVLFCEILEHLVINPLAVFPKLRRIIKPGGLLLITTPNAVRLANVALILAGSNIFDRYHPENGVYGRHNREFTVEELRRILEQSGFRIQRLCTLDRYDYNRIPIIKDNYEEPVRIPYAKALVEAWLKLGLAPLDHRGDNIYALAERIA